MNKKIDKSAKTKKTYNPCANCVRGSSINKATLDICRECTNPLVKSARPFRYFLAKPIDDFEVSYWEKDSRKVKFIKKGLVAKLKDLKSDIISGWYRDLLEIIAFWVIIIIFLILNLK